MKLQLDPENVNTTAPASLEDDLLFDEEDEQPRRPLKAARKGSRAAPIDVAEDDDDEFSSGELPVKGSSASQSSPLRALTAPLVDLTDDTPLTPAADAPLEKKTPMNNLADGDSTRASASHAEKELSFDLAKKNTVEKGPPKPPGSSATPGENEPLSSDTIRRVATSNADVAAATSATDTRMDITSNADSTAAEEQAPSVSVKNNPPPGGTENIAPSTIAPATAVVQKRVSTRKRKDGRYCRWGARRSRRGHNHWCCNPIKVSLCFLYTMCDLFIYYLE